MMSTTLRVDLLLRVLLWSTVAIPTGAQNCHWRSGSSGAVCCNNKCTKNSCFAEGCSAALRDCDASFTGVHCNKCRAGFTFWDEESQASCCVDARKTSGCSATERFSVESGAPGPTCTLQCTECPASAAALPGKNHRIAGCYDAIVKNSERPNPSEAAGAVLYGVIRTLRGHSDDVNSVDWSPDGSKLASGSDDDSVKIWNAATGAAIVTLSGHLNYVSSVSWSPDGSKLASGSWDNSVKIWDAAAGTVIATLTGHSYSVYSVDWSPDGSKLASGSADTKVKIWDAAAGTVIATLSGHSNWVRSVDWSPDGSKLASGSWDSSVKIWDAATGTVIATLSGHLTHFDSVDWSPDGSKLASGSRDTKVKIWDAATWTVIATLTGQSSGVLSVDWSPDGSKLASGSFDNSVNILDAATSRIGTVIATLSGHSDNVWSVDWSPDGSKLASGSFDDSVKIWDASPMCSGSAGVFYNTATLTCTKCPEHTGNPFDVHQEVACMDQPTCNAGSKYSGGSRTTMGTCEPCPPHTFQAQSNHRIETCTDQPTCKKGERIPFLYTLASDSVSCSNIGLAYVETAAECEAASKALDLRDSSLPVTASTDTINPFGCHYRSETEYPDSSLDPARLYLNVGAKAVRGTTRKGWQSICSSGATRARTCHPCPASTYQSSENHRQIECLDHQLTCSIGKRISPASTTDKQNCSLCPLNSFQNETNHRLETCTDQPTCGIGQFISPASSTSKQFCKRCPEYTFQAHSNHRNEACSAQPTCGNGTKISAASSKAKQICNPCPENTFQNETNHRIGTCTAQSTCSLGTYISAASSVLRQVCKPCNATIEYINVSVHRIEACFQQPFCGVGQYITAPDSYAIRTCLECPAHGYQNQTKHREQECTSQPTCGKGEFITASSFTSERSCKPCKENTYNDQDNRRIENCTQQPPCGRGEYYFAEPNNARERTCSKCTEYTFQTLTKHRDQACARQPFCGQGTVYRANRNNDRERVCTACPGNTYQSSLNHRNESCLPQIKCNGEFVGNATDPGECNVMITTETSEPGSPTNLGVVISGTAGGFIVLLVVAAAVYGVASRRNATRRAKDALLKAQEIFGIPCKNTACQDSQCHPSKSSVPAAGVLPTTVPPASPSKTSSSFTNPAFNTGQQASPQQSSSQQNRSQLVLNLDSVAGGWDDSTTDGDGDGDGSAEGGNIYSSCDPSTDPDSKFVAVMIMGDPKFMAIGLTTIMGVDVSTYKDLKEEKAIQKMIAEFKKGASAEHQQLVDGVIHGKPCLGFPQGLESLATIMAKPKLRSLKSYGLLSHHVLAIRLYTTDCYKPVNAPLRTHDKPHPQLPHPFAATMYYITDGLRKLKVASADDPISSSEQSILWRGVAGVGIAADFKSGTEMACMSTTRDPKVAALEFTKEDKAGFIFHVVCNDYSSKGQDISFISVYPHEKEVLYPPLTYLNVETGSKKVNLEAQAQIDRIMRANNRKPLKVVTVRPAYPEV